MVCHIIVFQFLNFIGHFFKHSQLNTVKLLKAEWTKISADSGRQLDLIELYNADKFKL